MRRQRAGSRPGPGTGATPAPACSVCGAALSGALRSVVVEASPGAGAGARPVAALYCGTCGATLGFLPATGGEQASPGAGVGLEAAGDGPPPGALRPGDRVVLQEGPWAGRDGVVRALEPGGEALVEMAGFGSGRRIRVSAEALRRR